MENNKARYIRKINTPTPFSQGPEMKNYSRMMELQSQAPNFTKNDPRFDELKDTRHQYNRFDKYKIGEKFNVAPLDVQKDFSNRSNVFRNAAPNVYGKMYPVSDMAMKYGDSGGLLGMMAKEMFGKLSDFGKSLTNKEGITGAANTDEAEMQDYAAKTFGMDGVPYPQQDFNHDMTPLPLISIEFNDDHEPVRPPNLTGENPIGEVSSMRSFGDRGTVPYGYEMNALDAIAEDDYRQGNKVTAYPPIENDFRGLPPDIKEPLPFDEGKEDYIRRQNEYNIPPPLFPGNVRQEPWETDAYLRWLTAPELGSADPHGDFSEELIYGAYPSSWNQEVTEVPYYGRGEMPQPSKEEKFYRNMREGIERGEREKELQDALAADQGRSLLTIPPDFDSNKRVFTDTEDYYEWIRQMEKYGYR